MVNSSFSFLISRVGILTLAAAVALRAGIGCVAERRGGGGTVDGLQISPVTHTSMRASARRCVKLRLETRALFGPTGSIVDRAPLVVI